MAAVWLVARTALRRRARALVVVTLLTGIAGAAVLWSFAAARRTDSSLSRLMDETRNDTASVEVGPEFFEAISELPEVESAAPASFVFARPAADDADDYLTLASTDGRFGSLVNRPRLVEGRRPVVDRADEVLLNTEAAARLDIGAGDAITLSSLTPAQLQQLIAGEDPGEPAGPRIEVQVTGVGVAADGIANRSPIILFTPAFYEAHRDDVAHFDDILSVRLKRGETDLEQFRAGVQRVVPESEGAIIETTAETVREFEDAIDVQTAALIAFAAAAALAGCVVIGQTISRELSMSTVELVSLRAIGLAPRMQYAAALAPIVVVATAAALIAAVLTVLASPAAPIGFARAAEPDPGMRIDWFVVGIGCLALALLVVAGSAVLVWRSVRRLAARDDNPPARRTSAVFGIVRARPAALFGVRMALSPGRGSATARTRSALAGAVIGVAGVMGALTFGAGLNWVVGDRAAYGWYWDTSVSGSSVDELEAVATAVSDDAAAEDVTKLSVLPVVAADEVLAGYGTATRKGAELVSVIDGRTPRSENEAMLGSQTLHRLGLDLGEELSLSSLHGGASRSFTIVGRGVFPEFVHPAVPDSDTGAYNDFALLTDAGIRAFVADARGEFFGAVLIRWAHGIDVATAEGRLVAANLDVSDVSPPPNLANLEHVDTFPSVVAGFLALLALAAMAHALASTARRRARDFATLRTLGFVNSQVRAALAYQASTIALIGLVIGIPAGIVIGRLVWAVVARNLGVDFVSPTPTVAVVVTITATLLSANLAAVQPATSATRARNGAVLRSE